MFRPSTDVPVCTLYLLCPVLLYKKQKSTFFCLFEIYFLFFKPLTINELCGTTPSGSIISWDVICEGSPKTGQFITLQKKSSGFWDINEVLITSSTSISSPGSSPTTGTSTTTAPEPGIATLNLSIYLYIGI